MAERKIKGAGVLDAFNARLYRENIPRWTLGLVNGRDGKPTVYNADENEWMPLSSPDPEGSSHVPIRPVLEFENADAQSIGETFKRFGYDWDVVTPRFALCRDVMEPSYEELGCHEDDIPTMKHINAYLGNAYDSWVEKEYQDFAAEKEAERLAAKEAEEEAAEEKVQPVVIGGGLLTVEQYEQYKQEIPEAFGYYWLKASDKDTVAVVNGSGVGVDKKEDAERSGLTNYFRPALTLGDSGEFKPGEHFYKFGDRWKLLSENLAICAPYPGDKENYEFVNYEKAEEMSEEYNLFAQAEQVKLSKTIDEALLAYDVQRFRLPTFDELRKNVQLGFEDLWCSDGSNLLRHTPYSAELVEPDFDKDRAVMYAVMELQNGCGKSEGDIISFLGDKWKVLEDNKAMCLNDPTMGAYHIDTFITNLDSEKEQALAHGMQAEDILLKMNPDAEPRLKNRFVGNTTPQNGEAIPSDSFEVKGPEKEVDEAVAAVEAMSKEMAGVISAARSGHQASSGHEAVESSVRGASLSMGAARSQKGSNLPALSRHPEASVSVNESTSEKSLPDVPKSAPSAQAVPLSMDEARAKKNVPTPFRISKSDSRAAKYDAMIPDELKGSPTDGSSYGLGE